MRWPILTLMIVAEAVLETFGRLTGFTAWPIAEPPRDHLLPLSGQMSPDDVGTAITVIFEYAGIPTSPPADPHVLLEEHLREAEALVAPGGLRFRDTISQAQFAPACCFGLESWREWQQVVCGKSIWLGHGPDPYLEHGDKTIRLWQDRDDRPSPPTLEINLTDLPNLLVSAQRQLQGFLDAVRQWASEISPAAANYLVAVLDENFEINDAL